MTNENISSRLTPEDIRRILPDYVTEKRFAHILSVEKTAERMYEAILPLCGDETPNLSDIRCAALLHDITKCKDQAGLVEGYGICLSDDDKASPETLHAITGAVYAADVFGAPSNICSAIEKHTVGGSDMSLLDIIVFVADYVEETRRHASCISAGEFLFSGLEAAKNSEECKRHLHLTVAYICAMTAEYLLANGQRLHRTTADTFLAMNGKSFGGIPGEYPLFHKYLG